MVLLIKAQGWRYMYQLMGGLSVIIGLCSFLFLKPNKTQADQAKTATQTGLSKELLVEPQTGESKAKEEES